MADATTRRWFPVRLADLPIEVRLAGAQDARRLYPDTEYVDLVAAAINPDPNFVDYISEPVCMDGLRKLAA